MATLVLSVIGDDRAGLVDALAGPIAEHGGNWDRSHMARLAGKFAGIVVVTVGDEHVDALTSAFEAVQAQGLLDVRVAIAAIDTAAAEHGVDAAVPSGVTLQLHLIGQDRPGIISEVARALAHRNVSIDELQTSTSSAPMSAEQLFEATATLRLPHDVDRAHLQSDLEDIANELMVDLDVSAPDHRSDDRR